MVAPGRYVGVRLHVRYWAKAAMVLAIAGSVAGCVSTPPEAGGPAETTIRVCHGFGCLYKTQVPIRGSDARRLAGYFARASNPAAERTAISRAVQHFEERAAAAIGKRDGPKSSARQNGLFGQMDCIDESQNTRALLVYLQGRGLLKHHKVESNVTCGLLLDSRYFHSTAVVRDSTGRHWAIDSWYEPAGGAPDIMPLDEWRKRGVMGER